MMGPASDETQWEKTSQPIAQAPLLQCCRGKSSTRQGIMSDVTSLVAQLCLSLRNPMDCSMPGLPVLHHLPEFAQAHVH